MHELTRDDFLLMEALGIYLQILPTINYDLSVLNIKDLCCSRGPR